MVSHGFGCSALKGSLWATQNAHAGGYCIIAHWLGWLALIGCLLLAAKFIGGDFRQRLRSCGVGSNVHKRNGVIMLVLACLHGVILITRGKLLTLAGLSGILALLCGLAVAFSYVRRRRLKAKWLPLHRRISVLFFAFLIVHILIVLNL